MTVFLLVLLKVFPFTPRYIIHVAGMMVSNAMTITEVAMKQVRQDIKSHMIQVETTLTFGATPGQATLEQVKRSLVIALSPVLDSTEIVVLISLPGAMTGLIMDRPSSYQDVEGFLCLVLLAIEAISH